MEHTATVEIPAAVFGDDALENAELTLLQELAARGCTEFDEMEVTPLIYRRRIHRPAWAKLLHRPFRFGADHGHAVCTMTGR